MKGSIVSLGNPKARWVIDCEATLKCMATGMPLASTPALSWFTPTGR